MSQKQTPPPHYEMMGLDPQLSELTDTHKTQELLEEIEKAEIPIEVKSFLTLAAYRHTVFNYKLIAEYYAHAPKEVQELMERSALVIIDFENALKNGYVRLNKFIRDNYVDGENAG